MNLFHSQNDPRWKNVTIGKSKSTLGQFGCTLDCLSDASSYFGEETTPDILAKKLSFLVDKVIWSSIGKFFKTFQFKWRFYKYDQNLIDDALLKNKNTVVLLNVNGGKHWVFALGKVPLLGYRCSDPYTFPAKTKYFSPASVVGGAILIRK